MQDIKSMSRPIVEQRVLGYREINLDLINLLRKRHHLGLAIVIADTPRTFLSALRKEWFKQVMSLLKARASTLDIAKIAELSQEIQEMESIQFDARGMGGNSADVYIISPAQLYLLPAFCTSIYWCSTQILNPTDFQNASVHARLVIDYSTSMRNGRKGKRSS